MDITSTCAEENPGLYKTFTGHVTISDILKFNLDLFSNPKFDSLKYIIFDFTEMSNETFEPNHTQAIARVAKVRANTKEHLKVALISRIQHDSIHAANLFCQQMKDCHYQCQVFHSAEDARQWVEV